MATGTKLKAKAKPKETPKTTVGAGKKIGSVPKVKINVLKNTVTMGLADWKKIEKDLARYKQEAMVKKTLTSGFNDVKKKISSNAKQQTLLEVLDGLQ